MQCIGCGELHAVVNPKSKDVGKACSRFHHWLADLNDGDDVPGLDQVLPSLFEIFVADRVFPLQVSQTAMVSAQLIRQIPMGSTVVMFCRI
jgi:hypothetical protein